MRKMPLLQKNWLKLLCGVAGLWFDNRYLTHTCRPTVDFILLEFKSMASLSMEALQELYFYRSTTERLAKNRSREFANRLLHRIYISHTNRIQTHGLWDIIRVDH